MENKNNEYIRLVKDYLQGEDFSYNNLERLFNRPGISHDLLNIKTFESAIFHLENNKVKYISNPNLERLSLVYPETFEVSLKMRISGHYMVKYAASGLPMPQQLSDIEVTYSCIITPQNNNLQIRNEQISFHI